MQQVIDVRIVAMRMVLMILGSPGLALKRVEINVNLGDTVSLFYILVFPMSHLSIYHLYMGIDAEPPMINMRPVCAASYSVSAICWATKSALNQIASEVQNWNKYGRLLCEFL